MNAKSNFMHFIVLVVCFAGLLAILYHYFRADSGVEHELKHIEELNFAIASESRQLQADIASHTARIASVSSRLNGSKERVRRVSEKIASSTTDVDRAIEVIEDCEAIIARVKTKRKR